MANLFRQAAIIPLMVKTEGIFPEDITTRILDGG